MRLRRHYKNYQRPKTESDKEEDMQKSEEGLGTKAQKTKESKVVKEAKPVKPLKMIRQIMNNPNFNMQIMVILLSLASDNMQMDRRIDGMTTTIDKVRNITELVNNGMQSMKMVSEVPKSIRRILE